MAVWARGTNCFVGHTVRALLLHVGLQQLAAGAVLSWCGHRVSAPAPRPLTAREHGTVPANPTCRCALHPRHSCTHAFKSVHAPAWLRVHVHPSLAWCCGTKRWRMRRRTTQHAPGSTAVSVVRPVPYCQVCCHREQGGWRRRARASIGPIPTVMAPSNGQEMKQRRLSSYGGDKVVRLR